VVATTIIKEGNTTDQKALLLGGFHLVMHTSLGLKIKKWQMKDAVE
jgi:hypothetical protein